MHRETHFPKKRKINFRAAGRDLLIGLKTLANFLFQRACAVDLRGQRTLAPPFICLCPSLG